jgi:hypothetical protein
LLSESLQRWQLKRLAQALHHDHVATAPRVLMLMAQVREFKRGDRVLMWCVRNDITGQRFIDFFKEEEGRETMGVLMGVQTALGYIDGKRLYKSKLYKDELK